MPKGFINLLLPTGDLQWQLYDMLKNRNEWWVPGKLVELRQRLEPYWRVSHPLPCCNQWQLHSSSLLACDSPSLFLFQYLSHFNFADPLYWPTVLLSRLLYCNGGSFSGQLRYMVTSP